MTISVEDQAAIDALMAQIPTGKVTSANVQDYFTQQNIGNLLQDLQNNAENADPNSYDSNDWTPYTTRLNEIAYSQPYAQALTDWQQKQPHSANATWIPMATNNGGMYTSNDGAMYNNGYWQEPPTINDNGGVFGGGFQLFGNALGSLATIAAGAELGGLIGGDALAGSSLGSLTPAQIESAVGTAGYGSSAAADALVGAGASGAGAYGAANTIAPTASTVASTTAPEVAATTTAPEVAAVPSLTPAQIESAVNTAGYGPSAAATDATGTASGGSGLSNLAANVAGSPVSEMQRTAVANLTGLDSSVLGSPGNVSPWSLNSLANSFGNNAVTNAELQALTTGKVDPNKMLTGAATGSLTGAISSTVAPSLTDTLPSWAVTPAANAIGSAGTAVVTGKPVDTAVTNSLIGSAVNGLVGQPITNLTGMPTLGSLANAYVGSKIASANAPGPLTTTNAPQATQPWTAPAAYDPAQLGNHNLKVFDPVFKQGVTA